MTITIVKGNPLAGVNNAAQVAAQIGILEDGSASYQDRKHAAGWLRGAWDVLRRTEKSAKAAEYIDGILRKHRYSEDTVTGD